MKKILSVILVCLLLFAVLCSCGKELESSPSSQSSSVKSSSKSSSVKSSSSSSKPVSSGTESSQSSSMSSVSAPSHSQITGFVPLYMQDLFSKNITDCFPAGAPDVLSTEGGSLWYPYQETPELIVLFSPFGKPEDNYLQGIYGAVELLFEGKQSVTLEEIKAVFGNDKVAEYNPMDGITYTAAYADGYTILFEYDSDADSACSFFKMKVAD